MGWVIAITLALLLLVAMLLVGRLPRTAWEITAAALLLGLAGYAWQGNPGMAGSPRTSADNDGDKFDEQLAEGRRGMAERYGPVGQRLIKTKEAINDLLSDLKQTPEDPNLWLALGDALIAHAGGTLSPSADFAFRRAITIEPEAPAPRYLYGLALARAGQLQGARELWEPLVDRVPANSTVRAKLEASIERIDQMIKENTVGTQ